MTTQSAWVALDELLDIFQEQAREDDYPIGAFAAVMVDLAACEGTTRFDPDGLSRVRVELGATGRPVVLSEGRVTPDVLMWLIRDQLSGQVVPPSLARLMLSEEVPAGRIAEVMKELSSSAQLRTLWPVASPVANDVRKPVSPSRGGATDAGRVRAERVEGVKADSRRSRSSTPGREVDAQAGFDDLQVSRNGEGMSRGGGSTRLVLVMAIALGVIGGWIGISSLLTSVTQAHGEPAASADPSQADSGSKAASDHSALLPGSVGKDSAPSPGSVVNDSVGQSQPAIGSAGEPVENGTAVDWMSVINALDAARLQAIASGDASALVNADVSGSPAAQQDSKLIAELVAAKVMPVGMRWDVLTVQPQEVSAASAIVQVRDIRSSYQLVPTSGQGKIERRPARSASNWTVHLQQVNGNWRIASAEETAEK